ncbi:terpene synthase family protein [Pseudomonas chlororaphis subsp. aurantiaca]|uniref:terpene synthase family protein n=1 Tax=Pseudomonas chlororaphis TaxID=587753 RepID=UPI00086648DA|nr:terpene synthase family protein [Pseudomonas chlororaphis]BAV75159.1 terpene synthase family protein [Pseudomonas chlororaphis subsp. aurantiaca]
MTTTEQDRYLVADYDLPAMPCSVPARINPHYPTIRERHAAWSYKFLPVREPHKIPRGIAQLDALFDSLTFPDGMPDRIYHHLCLLSTLVDGDDLAQQDPLLYEQVVLEQYDDPYSRAFADAWQTIRENAPTKAVYQRIRDRWRFWLLAVQKEIEWSKAPNYDYEEMFSIRLQTVGMEPYFVVAEYVLDIDAGDVANDPDAIDAMTAASSFIICVNDIFSHRKECLHGDSMSTVSALRRIHGYSVQQAIDTLYTRMVDLDAKLSMLLAKLHERYAKHPLGERIHTYIDTYHAIVAGATQWHLETPRYNGVGYIWDGLRTRHITVETEMLPPHPLS